MDTVYTGNNIYLPYSVNMHYDCIHYFKIGDNIVIEKYGYRSYN